MQDPDLMAISRTLRRIDRGYPRCGLSHAQSGVWGECTLQVTSTEASFVQQTNTLSLEIHNRQRKLPARPKPIKTKAFQEKCGLDAEKQLG
jgi:hypothetical protein